MELKVNLTWRNYDPFGKLINEKTTPGNSLLQAYFGLTIGFWAYSSQKIYSTDGVLRTCSNYSSTSSCRVAAEAGTDTYGLLVGTSNQAVSIDDYNLIAKITHGVGAGQLQYSAVSVDAEVVVDGSLRYGRVFRTFTNASGNSITINEIGLAGLWIGNEYLYDRTLTTNTIANGNSATLTFKISLAVY